MLNNKKLGIRLVAILMTLLMTVAIFAGCSDKKAQADAAAADSKAAAANAAAAAAQEAAQSAADAAAALAAQLAAAEKAAAEAKAAAAAAESRAAAAQSGVNSVANGTQPVDTDSLSQKQQKEVTDYINTTVLGELSQLKVRYLTVRYLWYTEANYLKVAKLFEDASNDIYRATTIDGVKGVIAKLTTDVIAIPSIMTDADAIQGQIKAFGEIDYELFLSHENNVIKARTDFTRFLTTYKSYFLANGINVETANQATINAFVLKNLSIAAANISYAESKITTLKGYATTVQTAAFDAVKTIWGKTAYSDIKTNSAAIEAAYSLYKIFMTANGGDGTPIKYTETTGDKRVLTGEQFVKQYVLILYDGWFVQYKQQAVNFLNTLPGFFMNAGAAGGDLTGLDAYLAVYPDAAVDAYYVSNLDDPNEEGSVDPLLSSEFQMIASLNVASFMTWTYSGSFKGTYSLDDAFLQVDNTISKAITEMATLYYNKIALPAIKTDFDALKKVVTETTDLTINYAAGTQSGKTAVAAIDFKDYDKAFAAEYIAAVDAYYITAAKAVTKTYDQLKASTNIEDLRILNYNTASNDVVTTFNGAALQVVLKALNETIKETGYSMATAKAELAELRAFYDFRVNLAKQLDGFYAAMDKVGGTGADADVLLDNINAANKAAGATSNVTAPTTANKAILTNFIKAVLALSYNSYSATTYQAVDAKDKALYYDKAALDKGKTTTTATGTNPLIVEVDKIVVAKDAAVALFSQYADQMLTALADLARANLNTFMDKSIALYNTNYAGDATVDTLNLKADMQNYITYLKTISALNSIGTFDAAVFSAENDDIAVDAYLDDLTDYNVETVKANNQYIFHVKDYKYTATQIYNSDAASYLTRANVKLAEYCNLQNVYATLEKVRLLAYYKDAAVLGLGSLKNDVIGVFDTAKGTWTKAPLSGYEYDYYSSRKVMYLNAVQEVYTKLVAAVNAITMLDEDVLAKPIGDQYTFAVSKIDAVVALSVQPQRATAEDAKKYDDYSFKVAYDRYYATNGTGLPVYDWSLYNK